MQQLPRSPVPSPSRLKAKAKALRTSSPILSQLAALDQAAVHLGWPSYKSYFQAWQDARQSTAPPPGRFEVTIVAPWSDPDKRTRGIYETVVSLSQPWWEFLSLPMRAQITPLGMFRVTSSDRSKLAAKVVYPDYHSAKNDAVKAAKRLAFVDVMRVLPATWVVARKSLQHNFYAFPFPSQDHMTFWSDPTTGAHFLLNEPYQSSLNGAKQKQRLHELGFEIATIDGAPMHSIGTVTQLVALAGTGVVQSLEQRSHGLPAALRRVRETEGSRE